VVSEVWKIKRSCNFSSHFLRRAEAEIANFRNDAVVSLRAVVLAIDSFRSWVLAKSKVTDVQRQKGYFQTQKLFESQTTFRWYKESL